MFINGRFPLILTQQKWQKKLIFKKKNPKLFIPTLLSLEKMLIVLNLKTISAWLDSKLNFDIHVKEKFEIVKNSIALLRKLRYFVPLNL